MGEKVPNIVGVTMQAPSRGSDAGTAGSDKPCCGVDAYSLGGGAAGYMTQIDSTSALEKRFRIFADNPKPARPDAWKSRLYAPTFFTKIGEDYFIVDCWHNRVLYTQAKDGRINWDLSTWEVMDEGLAGPHSIASDGEIYVVEDTGYHNLRVYIKTDEGFEQIQTIENVGERPHRLRYDSATKSFYALGGKSQEITKLVRDGYRLKVAYKKTLPFLEGRYSRSMAIIDGTMYFVSNGPGASITQVKYDDGSYEVIKRWEMPEHMHGMNDVFRSHDGWFYVTYSSTEPGGMRALSLDEIAAGGGEDIALKLGIEGRPYYISEVDGRIFVPEISVDGCNAIHSFEHGEGGAMTHIEMPISFDEPIPQSLEQEKSLPK